MKYIITLMLSLIITQSYAVEITDYKPPESKLSDLDTYFYFSYTKRTESDDSTSHNYSTRMIGKSNTNYKYFHYSDDINWSFNSNLELNYNSYPPHSPLTLVSSNSLVLNKYLEHDIYVSLAGNFKFVQNEEFDFTGAFAWGVGVGRYYNATSIITATRIQEELIEEGIITEPFPDSILIELATELDNSPNYILKREHYRQIVAILEKHVQIATLPGIGLYRVLEVVERMNVYTNTNTQTASINTRAFGYRIGIENGIGDLNSDYYQSLPPYLDPDYLHWYVEYAHPLNNKLQLVSSVDYSRYYHESGRIKLDDEIIKVECETSSWSGMLGIAYEISDRIRSSISNTLNYGYSHDEYFSELQRDRYFNNALEFVLSYYLEDNVYGSINIWHRFTDDNDNREFEYRTNKTTDLTFNLGYDIF
jgi:hypothetical protein